MIKIIRNILTFLILTTLSANSIGEELFRFKSSSGPITAITKSQITIGTYPTTTANITDSTAVFDRVGEIISIKDIKVGDWIEVTIIKIDGNTVIKQITKLR